MLFFKSARRGSICGITITHFKACQISASITRAHEFAAWPDRKFHTESLLRQYSPRNPLTMSTPVYKQPFLNHQRQSFGSLRFTFPTIALNVKLPPKHVQRKYTAEASMKMPVRHNRAACVEATPMINLRVLSLWRTTGDIIPILASSFLSCAAYIVSYTMVQATHERNKQVAASRAWSLPERSMSRAGNAMTTPHEKTQPSMIWG